MSQVRKISSARGTGTVQFKRIAAAAVVGVVAASAGQQARAADWIVADDNWTNPAAWSTAVVPGPTEPAFINFVGGVAHVNTDLVDDVLTVRVQNGSTLSIEPTGDLRTVVGASATIVDDPLFATRVGDGSAGTVTIDSGAFHQTFTIPDANRSADIYVGVAAGGIGSFSQTGATSLVYTRDMRIGWDTGVGTYNLNGGTLQTNWNYVGNTGGTGTLNVDGGTLLANLTTGARLQVGNLGGSTGTVNLTSGTISTTGLVLIGIGNTTQVGTGNVVHTGGLLTTTNGVEVGTGGNNGGLLGPRGMGTYTLGVDGTSTAVIDVNSAALTQNGEFTIGRNGGKGTMVMNGGTVTTDAGFFVGYNTAGNVANRSEGTMTMNGGTLTVGGTLAATGNTAAFSVGNAAGTGSFVLNGGTVSVTGLSGVAHDADRTAATRATLASGTFVQHGGTFSTTGNFTVGTGSGSGIVTLDQTAVMNIGTGTTGDLLVGGNDNATSVHTQSNTMTIADSAAVTVAGAFRMAQGGGKGTFVMSGGTLSVGGASLIGQSSANASAIATISGGTATFGNNLTVGDAAASAGTLTVTGGTLNVTGALVAGRNATVSGMITQSGGTINAGSLGIRTNTGSVAATDFNLTGGTLNVTGAVTNNSTFDVSNTAAANVGAIGGTGNMTVAGTATVNAASVRQASLTMTGGTVKIAETTTGTATGVSVVPALSLTGTSRFDLTDNKLVTNVPVGTGVAGGGNYTADSVSRYVQTGSNGGAWDGPGITTSKGDATAGLTSIGVALASDVRDFGLGTTLLFAGQTITPTNTLAMYTYAGDANLDGQITGDDYSGIDFAIQDPGNTGGWFNGDFNYDGAVTGDDYSAIDFNILAQGAPFTTAAGLSGVSAVPEPASLALVASAAGGLLLRRRRTCRGG